MVGFTAAYAKTITTICERLKEDKELQYLFCSILTEAVEGRDYLWTNLNKDKYPEIKKILLENGFSISNENEDMFCDMNVIVFLIKW